MSDLTSLNQQSFVKQPKVELEKKETPVETGGVIASNTPSPLFNAMPSVETGGSIASNSSSSSGGSSSGGTNYVC